MKGKITSLLFLILGCVLEEPRSLPSPARGPECPIGLGHCTHTEESSSTDAPPEREEITPDDELPIEADIDPLADGPVFEGTEIWDKCCPVIDGTIRDTGCFDDISNSCTHLSGSTTWYILNCNTCGTNSVNCSSTRWSTPGLFGAECLALATRKYTNAIVDDDCNSTACVGAALGTWKAEDPPANVPICVNQSEDDVQTWRYNGATNTLCCKAGEWTDCIPMVGGNCGSTGALAYHGYTYERWCSPCDGYSVGDGSFGGWDLRYDGSPEWAASVVCDNLYYNALGDWPNFGDPAHPNGGAGFDIFGTRYDCGGYAFAASGTLINNNCD